jgi:Fic family protein
MKGGNWKATDNDIVEVRPDGKKVVRFKPTPAWQTEEAMAMLHLKFKESQVGLQSLEPLLGIASYVLDFLCIHPFSDGNGSVARLLTLLTLYHFDYQVGRYISLERIFEETKDDYYRTLQESSKKWHQGEQDIKPWMNYFWISLLRAYREFEERVGTIKPGRGSKTDQVRKAVERQIVPFAISDIEKECPWISRDMIRLVLREMKAEGLIKSTGKGRSAKWKII